VDSLAARAAALQWYHSIELAPGVVTRGWFDTRAAVERVPLPRRMDGLRCLDVGTWDGFWAFEMERRGAAEVVAIDVEDPDRWDWPPRERLQPERFGVQVLEAVKGRGEGFALAREALRSHVERRDLSVYDLDPAGIGHFDVVFLGSLLLHLRDPVRALERLRGVCGGTLVVADTVEVVASLVHRRRPVARLQGLDRPWWWQPNRAALVRMVRSAGFTVEQASRVYYVPTGEGHPRPRRRSLPRRLLSPRGREEVVVALRGVPHVAILARPS
jgi:tRNA (mo5U34)-methyltransferase